MPGHARNPGARIASRSSRRGTLPGTNGPGRTKKLSTSCESPPGPPPEGLRPPERRAALQPARRLAPRGSPGTSSSVTHVPGQKCYPCAGLHRGAYSPFLFIGDQRDQLYSKWKRDEESDAGPNGTYVQFVESPSGQPLLSLKGLSGKVSILEPGATPLSPWAYVSVLLTGVVGGVMGCALWLRLRGHRSH